jgi:hypothetical protein
MYICNCTLCDIINNEKLENHVTYLFLFVTDVCANCKNISTNSDLNLMLPIYPHMVDTSNNVQLYF